MYSVLLFPIYIEKKRTYINRQLLITGSTREFDVNSKPSLRICFGVLRFRCVLRFSWQYEEDAFMGKMPACGFSFGFYPAEQFFIPMSLAPEFVEIVCCFHLRC